MCINFPKIFKSWIDNTALSTVKKIKFTSNFEIQAFIFVPKINKNIQRNTEMHAVLHVGLRIFTF